MEKILRILVIVSSEDDTDVLMRTVQRCGYEVEFERAETLAAVQIALTEKPWDLLVCEYNLPGFSTLQVIKLLKEHNLYLPFLLVSNPIHEGAILATWQKNTHDFLVRGNLTELGAVLEQELSAGSLHRENSRTEQGTQNSEALFGMAFQLSPIGICMTSLDGTLENVNPALLDMLG